MAEPDAGDACQHHWIIERPICRLCDEERDFPNYLPSNPHIQKAAWRTRRPVGQLA